MKIKAYSKKEKELLRTLIMRGMAYSIQLKEPPRFDKKVHKLVTRLKEDNIMSELLE